MEAIICSVLSLEETAGRAASTYIDDIYVNKDVMTATRVIEHLIQFGLECKDPERLEDGTRALGLAVAMEHGELRWKRRTAFSLYRRLVGHLQMCGWLRVAGGILESKFGHKGWDDETKDTLIQHIVSGTVDSVQWDDPVRGDWCMDSRELNVRADDSSLALERYETVLEDACWLRPENDAHQPSRTRCRVEML